MKILITGGTGKLGSRVTADLVRAGQSCTVLTSRQGATHPTGYTLAAGDLVSGKGLRAALSGQQIIIHCASNFSNHEQVDVAGTANLLQHLDARSTAIVIYVSIVGIADSPLPYYRSKRAAEMLIEKSGYPFRILRFTQFHDFVYTLLQGFETTSKLSGELSLPGNLRFQSISMHDASRKISESLEIGSDLYDETGGPEVFHFEEMAADYLFAKRQQLPVRLFETSDPLLKAFQLGKNLTPNRMAHSITWKQFLATLPAMDNTKS